MYSSRVPVPKLNPPQEIVKEILEMKDIGDES